VFVGGPPAMTLAAVMPLPEGLAEIMFSGGLTRRRPRMTRLPSGHLIHADADFCIVGEIDPDRQLPEGPFGDHLGYYSLQHDFPVLRVQQVFHRNDAVWPFTVVGRPPQEDTTFGALIHELTGPVIPTVLPGVRAVHAVDATGVHPLLLAIGSERYVPYAERREPQELLTQANAILGQGQMSLAKYVLIAAEQDDPQLDIHDASAVLQHILCRFDPQRDLHFQTRTTIDTLDYSGQGLNQGSKLVIAAVGKPIRTLGRQLPSDLRLPDGFSDPRLCLPGVIAVNGPTHIGTSQHGEVSAARLCEALKSDLLAAFPWIVIVDDSEMVARSLDNFLWVTFTRSNPAVDLHGVGAGVVHKHWGCVGPVVIDARIKSHHAPPLIEDPAVSRRVDALAAAGGPLHGLF
jgi:4-hydroxy-3-polyprenylbenzoate decarboxylase